ncbi:DNA primase [Streptomyces kebangsaanensis]|uniref:DNA primase n=1 Tax=Streptomyces kebangsaanensis TaxID=864058 RepID=A0ABW6KLX7_9ACTN|nr:DNA primase [Streptomyces kebangsaanensis]
MNRTALGLAVGAGYLLGRTKKAKLALAVGSMVAGKKMNLGPRQLADLVNQQLKNNPQFKEIGDQLRQDLRGVGKAASGAMVERQMTALADRLHGRTSQVRDQLAGVVPKTGGDGGEKETEGEYEDEYEDREGREAGGEPESAGESEEEPEGGPARKEAAKKAPPAKKAPAGKAPAKKAPAKKAAAKKTAAGKKTAAKKTAAAGNATRAVRSRLPKGGGDR